MAGFRLGGGDDLRLGVGPPLVGGGSAGATVTVLCVHKSNVFISLYNTHD